MKTLKNEDGYSDNFGHFSLSEFDLPKSTTHKKVSMRAIHSLGGIFGTFEFHVTVEKAVVCHVHVAGHRYLQDRTILLEKVHEVFFLAKERQVPHKHSEGSSVAGNMLSKTSIVGVGMMMLLRSCCELHDGISV